jgi:hypothetical protein
MAERTGISASLGCAFGSRGDAQTGGAPIPDDGSCCEDCGEGRRKNKRRFLIAVRTEGGSCSCVAVGSDEVEGRWKRTVRPTFWRPSGTPD